MAVDTTTYIYLGAGNVFWRLTVEEWIQLCKARSNGDSYDMQQYTRLNQRPRWLLRHVGEQSFYRNRNDRYYYEPAEWEKEDFIEALGEALEIREKTGD